MSESQRGGTTGDGGTSRPPVITYIVGIALIIMYIIFVALAWRAVDEAAKVWVHRIGLLGGLETLAFSGAGVILGVTVQRPAVRAAERRAQANERAATAGRAVVAAAKVKAGRADDLLLTYRGADRLEQGFASEFQELVGLAQEIDPDTGRQ